MKGKAKRLASLLLVLVLMLSSTMLVSASNSTTIKRSTAVSSTDSYDHTEVSVAEDTTDRGSCTFQVKRSDDTFDMYRIVDITPGTVTGTSITSLSFSWVKPVQDFINANDTFKNDEDYATPEALGAFQYGTTLTGDDQSKLIALFNAIKEDTTTMAALKTGYTTVGTGDDAYNDPYLVAQVTADTVATLETATSETVATKASAVNSVSYTKNSIALGLKAQYSGNTGAYTVSAYDFENLPFGIYFLNVANTARTDNGGYQPVVIDMIPEQTGPSGHWYMDNTRTFQVKNEGLQITKKINNQDEDEVGVGDIVTFKITFQIPDYPKYTDTTTDHTAGTYMYDWFSAFDQSTKGFTLIPSSATLTYFDSNDNEYHAHATMVQDSYGNLSASDAGGTISYYSATSENENKLETATVTAENTYTANLLTTATPYVSSADTASEKTVYFWTTPETATTFTVWTQKYGELVKVTSGISAIDSATINLINDKRGSDEQIPTSYSATTFQKLDYTQSLLGISFDYKKLMTDSTYDANAVEGKNKTSFYTTAEKITESRTAAFTHPDYCVVTYDAIINDDFEIGNDDNNNTVYLNYIIDTNGTREHSSATVKAWSYGLNILKVDGEKYTTYEAATDKESLVADADTNPFLEGAQFDLYKFDTEYCGGSTATTEPTATDQSSYSYYTDTANTFTSSVASATRFATAKSNYLQSGQLYKAIRYELTEKAKVREGITIAGVISSTSSQLGNWLTADTFTNKYNFANIYANVTSLSSYDLLGDYMIPHAAYTVNTTTYKWNTAAEFTGSGKAFVMYVPEKVTSCDFCSTEHYHLMAYVLVHSNITSNATADGIDVDGLDYGQYLLSESKAPDGYNNLDSSIYFEINEYNSDQYTAAGSSNKGFITDEYEHDDGTTSSDNQEDGRYPFTIKNYTGLTLPSTGGMGTLLFTIIGIIIMVAAIIFVIMKNRKIAKNATAFMMAALMVVGTVAGLIATPFTSQAAKIVNTTSSSTTSGGSTASVLATQGGTATFTVWLNNPTDTLEVYQIGTTEYSTDSKGWTDPQWVSKIKNTMLDNTNGFEATTDYECPTDPTLYGEASTEVQTAFLSWIYDNRKVSNLDTVDISSKLTKATTKSTNNRYKATISGLTYGIYLIKATSANGNEYQSLLMSAVPQQTGPSGGWYVTGIQEAYLKYADLQIVKKINNKDSDVVRDSEKVTFTVIMEVPDYQAITYWDTDELGNLVADVITDQTSSDYTSYDWDKYYKYAFTDVQSDAFNTDTAKYATSPDTVTVEYTVDEDAATFTKVEDVFADSLLDTPTITWTTVPNTTGTNYELLFANAYDSSTLTGLRAFKSSTDTAGLYFLMNATKTTSTATSATCTWYLYDSKKGTITKLGTDTAVTNPGTLTPSTTIQTAYKTAAGIDSTTSLGTISASTDITSFKGITFDYAQLHTAYRASSTADQGDSIPSYVRITYTASVTEDCLPGVETNDNTAYVWYRTNVSGDYDEMDDTVNAYTYGLNLVKTDGSTSGTSTTYLKDAKFQLYKEAYIFVPSTSTFTTAPDSSNYENFVFLKGAENDEYKDTATLNKDDAAKTLIGAKVVDTVTNTGTEETPVYTHTYTYTDAATLKAFNEASGTHGTAGLQYYFRYVPVELAAGSDATPTACSVAGCPVTNTTDAAVTHYHVHVYNQMTLKDQTSTDSTASTGVHTDVTGNEIWSVASADGVTVQGLEDASYVLIETTAPTGYNPLTEAMRFEIHTLTDTEKTLAQNAEFTTDRTFVSSTVVTNTEGKTDIVTGDDGTTKYQGYSNGIYGVTVKNYKGLTLPSTGGMGTLLFTIIGIVIMVVAMMVVIAKNKKKASYM